MAASWSGEAVAPGDRVILYAKNAPEWSMAYFGILKAGATAVPIGYESTVAEMVNIARASSATGILIDDDLWEKRSTLTRALHEAGLGTKVWPFQKVFELPDLDVEHERAKSLHKKCGPDTVASLIFTSGTTGKPKGVMLTHRNFTFMVSELSKVFEFGVNDGMLSVLPLHHTFEFSTGLLVPLAHGAQITYLPELTGDAIASALKKGHVTAIVGVPALWELMRRRVLQKFSDKSPIARRGGARPHRRQLRAALAHQAGSRHAVLPAGPRGVRRAHPLPDQRRLGAAARGAEDLLRHGLLVLRGLRPDRDRAGADRDLAQGASRSRARSGSRCPGSR